MPTKDVTADLTHDVPFEEGSPTQHRSEMYLREALRLRDTQTGEDSELYWALRYFAASAPVEGVPRLLMFLRDEDQGRTHQCVMQGLQAVLEVEKPLDTGPWARLRERVDTLAHHHLTRWFGDQENATKRVLAANCFLTLFLLDPKAEVEATPYLAEVGLLDTLTRIKDWRFK